MTFVLLYLVSLSAILLTLLLMGLTRASAEDADERSLYLESLPALSPDLMADSEPLLS